jgi:hypothetical protein
MLDGQSYNSLPMATLTLAADVAWRLAANEALACGSTTLEPAHLLIGILSIEKVFSPYLAERMKVTEFGLSTVRVEWQEALRAVSVSGMSPALLRREVRAELPKQAKIESTGVKPKVSRSALCKRVFARAGELAEAAGSTVAGIRYLLYALIDEGNLSLPPDLANRIERIKTPLASVIERPLHQSISSIEQGYISDQAIAPTIDRRRNGKR